MAAVATLRTHLRVARLKAERTFSLLNGNSFNRILTAEPSFNLSKSRRMVETALFLTLQNTRARFVFLSANDEKSP